MLIDNLNIRIIHAATGEILRTLTLDPTRTYNRPATNAADHHAPTAPTDPEKTKTQTHDVGSGHCRCLATSQGGDDGNRTHDLFIANEALCQLSYIPEAHHNSGSLHLEKKPQNVMIFA